MARPRGRIAEAPAGRAAIVVLGAAVWPGGRPSPTLSRRIETAVAAFRSGHAAWIIASGGLGHHPPAEAEVMRDALVAAGVPAPAVLIEDRSTSTLENAGNSAALMAAHGLETAYVVTDGYHLPRALMAFRAMGVAAHGIAVPRDPRTPLPRWLWSWLREAAALPVYALKLRRLSAASRPRGS